ncbi:MAG: class I SAM-dependent methyltransferase [Desulfobacteraceae bacterium]|nr:MAG: class I SAM-dependent methyltransferase [Desulfobacteraceae bacterium]
METIQEMQDFYSKNHREYFDRTFNIDPSLFLSPLTEQLAPGAFILDVGCGSGRDLLWLKNRGFQVMGFERSHELAELARKSAGCEVFEEDFTSYDFSSIRADAVILIGALAHIPHADFMVVLRNVTAALDDNGLILITVKEGTGVAEGADGRVFYFFQNKDLETIFASLKLRLLDFSRNTSKTGTGEIWLRYLLQKK